MIAGEGHTIYVSGDTDIMADMAWMGELHQPDIGILSAGGHFTMDMARAAFAARKYFNFTHRDPLPLPHLPAAGTGRRRAARGLPPGITDRTPGPGADPVLKRKRGAVCPPRPMGGPSASPRGYFHQGE